MSEYRSTITKGGQVTLPAKIRRKLGLLEVYAAYSQLDFEHALTVAHMEAAGISEVVSYGRDFGGVPGVTRVEP